MHTPQVLRPMNAPEYAAWLAATVPAYSADKVTTGRWAEDQAVELATREYEQLLPKGFETENNYFFVVLDESGSSVGSLWFVEAPRIGYKVAYLFDIIIWPNHRRMGHARRALAALEIEAAARGLAGIALHVFGHNKAGRSLYSRLGYEPTNINLYKPLSLSSQSDA